MAAPSRTGASRSAHAHAFDACSRSTGRSSDEVRTERLLLRQWRDADAGSLAEIYALRRRWADGFAHWAAEDLESGRLIGRIGLLRHHDWPLKPSPVEVGWTLHRDWWRRGLATEGGRAPVDVWRKELVADPRLPSITTVENVRSAAVMCRLAFIERGMTFWYDAVVVWYAVERDG